MENINVTNKLTLCAALTFSLVSSAAVFAAQADVNKNAAEGAAVKAEATAPTAKNVVGKKKVKKVKSNVTAGTKTLAQEVQDLKVQVAELKQQKVNYKEDKEQAKSGTAFSKLYAYGPALVTSPIIGEPAYDGSDLLINSPSINEDLALLKLNQKVDNYYAQNNIQAFDRPILAFSGMLEAQALSYSRFNNDRKSDIDLSTAAFEVVARANSWVSGLMRFEYDNNSAPDYGSRTTGSKIKLKRGYITVGNLEKFPLYASVGQMYVPFGQFDNWRITDPVTQTLARTQARPLVVGFSKNGFDGSVYTFKGDTYTASSSTLKQWGANLAYTYTAPAWKLNVGGGYIANIADSLGMQDNAMSSDKRWFWGFRDGQQLKSRVQAVDLHTTFTYLPIAITAEYVAAIDRFDKSNLTFNSNGAKPSALNIEGVYNFKVLDKPSFVTAGYAQTWESLAFNLPRYSYFVGVGTSLFKSTWQCLEYRHDINYDSKDIAIGQGYVMPVGKKERDMIIASFKIFF